MADADEWVKVRPNDFDGFFRAEYERLARALFLVTGDPLGAEEVAQEAMVRVLERWDRVSKMLSPEGYLFRVALNLERSRLRRMATAARRAVGPGRHAEPAEAVETRDTLDRALASLPRGQRHALTLVEWLGMSDVEAGEVLGIAPASVRARISRARSALRDWHAEEHADD